MTIEPKLMSPYELASWATFADVANPSHRALLAHIAAQEQVLAKACRERDEAIADGVLSQRVCDLENNLAQLRADRAAQEQRIAELEADGPLWLKLAVQKLHNIVDDYQGDVVGAELQLILQRAGLERKP